MGILRFVKSITPFFLYAAGGIVFFISLSGRVWVGLNFLIPLLPLQNILEKMQILPLGKDFADILLIGMIIGWMASKASLRESFFSRSPFNKLIFIFFCYTLFSLWKGSFYLGASLPLDIHDPRLQNWKNYMVLPLIFLLVLNNIRDISGMKRMFLTMCVSMILMNFYVVRQVSDVTAWWNRDKISGTFVWLGVNEVAAFYAAYVFVLIGVFFFIKDKRWKIGLGWLIFISFYCILFMFSRGAYMAVVAGLLFIAFTRKRWLFIPLIFLFLLWHTVLPQTVVDRIQFSERGEGTLDNSAETRLMIWQVAMSMFSQNPIFGSGYNILKDMGLMDTHNIYVKFLAEQGIVGLFIFLAIMFLAVRRAWRLHKRAQDPFLKGLSFGFCGCVFAFMIGNFFGERWIHIPLSAFFWTFLGMVERGNIIVDSETSANSLKKKNNAKSTYKNNSAN
ncbi:MAG: O-antigen ligase family protein [Candidatus Omnitrophica bacterium]|nr:O-antigen ligase family protein [Candidatus Omnitrophota bacterium]